MTGDESYKAGLRAGREEAARFLLAIGFADHRRRPPPGVLDEMVSIAADDPRWVDTSRHVDVRLEEAFDHLAAEFGDWRAPGGRP